MKSLHGTKSWDPSALLSALLIRGVARWRPLGRFQLLKPNVYASRGIPVVAGTNVDSIRIDTKYEGPAYLVGTEEHGPRTGDLLISPYKTGSSFILSEQDAGRYFSSRFIVVRIASRQDIYAFWAALTFEQQSALAKTHGLAGYSVRRNTRELSRFQIPILNNESIERLSAIAREFHIPRSLNQTLNAETWWKVCDLQEFGWQRSAAVQDPSKLETGLVLSDIAEVAVPKFLGRNNVAARMDGDNRLPVLGARYFASGEIRQSRAGELTKNDVLVEPGDLVWRFSAHDVKVHVVDIPGVLGQMLVRVRPKNDEYRDAIVGFLSSEVAERSLETILHGSNLVRRLTSAQAKSFPVPATFMEFAGYKRPEPKCLAQLSSMIEGALCS